MRGWGGTIRAARITLFQLLLPSLLLTACGSSATNARTSGSPATGAVWLAMPATFPAVDQSLRTTLLVAASPPAAVPEKIISVRESADFAYIVAVPIADGWAGEGDILVAMRDASGWHVVSRSDTTAFCDALAKAPAGMISEPELAYLAECS